MLNSDRVGAIWNVERVKSHILLPVLIGRRRRRGDWPSVLDVTNGPDVESSLE